MVLCSGLLVFTHADEAAGGTVLAGAGDYWRPGGEEYEVGVGSASKHISPQGSSSV